MKKILSLVMFMISVFVFSQKTEIKKNQIDQKLVGSWSGEEKDNQIEGMHKSWIMHRAQDGTFLLLFVTIEDGEITTFTEKGQWWVENGKFYELHKTDGKTDVYDYEILDINHIKFKTIKLSIKQKNTDYEFIDTRLE